MIHRVRTVAIVVAGFVLVAIGLVLSIPGIPGPGLVLILLGLALLSRRFVWARKVLAWARSRVGVLRRKWLQRMHTAQSQH